ncbi:MAG: L,D-transpeptidase [Eubacteriales bacterium]|nr:L,D-transpeptidase [Eubacteriales bacterium]
MKIVIHKSERLLTACEGGREVFRCSVQLGAAPVGQKRAEGDGRTPEGRFYVCTKNPQSKFHLALGVSYPDEPCAKAALLEGRIGPEQYAAVAKAQRERKRPPWDTPLGGFIMLHGEHPEGKTGDWTAGCVAMRNGEIERLFALAQLGDEIEILP